MSEMRNGVNYYPSYDACRISAERLESLWFRCASDDPSYPQFKSDIEDFSITYVLRRLGLIDDKRKRPKNGKKLRDMGIQIGENFAKAESVKYKDQVFTKGNVVSPEWFKGKMPACVAGIHNRQGHDADGLALVRDTDWMAVAED